MENRFQPNLWTPFSHFGCPVQDCLLHGRHCGDGNTVPGGLGDQELAAAPVLFTAATCEISLCGGQARLPAARAAIDGAGHNTLPKGAFGATEIFKCPDTKKQAPDALTGKAKLTLGCKHAESGPAFLGRKG